MPPRPYYNGRYKDQITPYITSRTAAAHKIGHIAVAPSELPSHDLLSSTLGPMLRMFQERVDPYYSLRMHPDAHRSGASTLCQVGANDEHFAQQLATRLRMYRVAAFDAAATPEGHDAAIRPFNGRDLPLSDLACEVTVFPYMLHKATYGRLTGRLLAEARRVTSGYVLIAEDRAGRTAAENERNAAVDQHGTFRSEREWYELLTGAGFEVIVSGPMFAPTAPQMYMIARPVNATR